MKIAIVTAGVLPFPPIKGGAVENLIKFYIDYNEDQSSFHEFTVFTISDKMVMEEDLRKYCHVFFRSINVNVIVRTFELYRDFVLYKLFRSSVDNYYIKKVVSYLIKEEFDLIIVENRPEFVLPIVRKKQNKIVLHLHNDTLNLTTPNARKILESCDAIWCVSNFVKRKVEMIQKSDKIKVLYNGVDVANFILDTSILSLKRRFGFEESDFVIVYSGRIDRNKGIQELIEAFVRLKVEGDQQSKLLILGSAFYGTGRYKNFYFKKMVQYIDKYKKDICFTGFVCYDEIPKYLSMADISVVPSVWDEPFGMTVVESLSIGLPLIVSDGGGIPEIVTSDCAIQIKRDRNFVENMAVSIKYLKENPDVRFYMSESARKRSLFFSKEHYCNDFFSLLKGVL